MFHGTIALKSTIDIIFFRRNQFKKNKISWKKEKKENPELVFLYDSSAPVTMSI